MGTRGVRPASLAARFWPKVDFREWEPGSCWEWIYARNRGGYGVLASGGHTGRPLLAHRVSYELHFGAIPDDGPPPYGWIVQHTCDNPACVNPAHLTLGTYATNNADMLTKGRYARGETNGQSILTTHAVRAIRAALAAGSSYSQQARRHRCSVGTIYKIANNKSWTHI